MPTPQITRATNAYNHRVSIGEFRPEEWQHQVALLEAALASVPDGDGMARARVENMLDDSKSRAKGG